MDELDWKIRRFLVDEGYLFPITDAEIERALKVLVKYMETKYLILTLNTAHPSNPYAFFLQCEEDEDGRDTERVLLFPTHEAAAAWCVENEWPPYAYSILCTDDFHYE